MPPAARITDMHTCPMVTGTVPHVGGPILPPACPTVLIGNLPAARVGDMLVCVGPTDVIAKGSPTVIIGGMLAARIGDLTVHGGVIVVGCPTVIIGEVGMGRPVNVNHAISDSAYKMVGTSTVGIPGTQDGKLGCAAAVSMMFKDATGQDILRGKPTVLGTGELYDGLSKDPRFVKIPLADAQPGDIVITARGIKAGHTGIVGNNNEIISNSSNGFHGSEPGTIQNNYTIDRWEKGVSPRNPHKTAAFRYIGP